jgi:hypothetical protein
LPPPLYTNITPAAPAIAPANPIFLNPLAGTAAPVASEIADPLVALSVLLPTLLVPDVLSVLVLALPLEFEPTLALALKVALLDGTAL